MEGKGCTSMYDDLITKQLLYAKQATNKNRRHCVSLCPPSIVDLSELTASGSDEDEVITSDRDIEGAASSR